VQCQLYRDEAHRLQCFQGHLSSLSIQRIAVMIERLFFGTQTPPKSEECVKNWIGENLRLPCGSRKFHKELWNSSVVWFELLVEY